MNISIARAIQERRLLKLAYHGYYRLVEPHAYGINPDHHEILRCWQVEGGSESGERSGWKLLRVDEIHTMTCTEQRFSSPRNGYKRGDSAMMKNYVQL